VQNKKPALTYRGIFLTLLSKEKMKFLSSPAPLPGNFCNLFQSRRTQMLEVTELATAKLKAYLADNNIESPVRVALMQGG